MTQSFVAGSAAVHVEGQVPSWFEGEFRRRRWSVDAATIILLNSIRMVKHFQKEALAEMRSSPEADLYFEVFSGVYRSGDMPELEVGVGGGLTYAGPAVWFEAQAKSIEGNSPQYQEGTVDLVARIQTPQADDITASAVLAGLYAKAIANILVSAPASEYSWFPARAGEDPTKYRRRLMAGGRFSLTAMSISVGPGTDNSAIAHQGTIRAQFRAFVGPT